MLEGVVEFTITECITSYMELSHAIVDEAIRWPPSDVKVLLESTLTVLVQQSCGRHMYHLPHVDVGTTRTT